MRDYVRIADRYAESVVAGRILAARATRDACERYLRDRAASRSEWVLDRRRVAALCQAIEALPHVKGEWAAHGEQLILSDWQVWLFVQLFGWVSKKSNLRRFRTAYLSVARKNGKTTLLAAMMLYMLGLDGEPGAEVYSAATTRDQAGISFGIARQMVRRSPAYRRATGCRVGAYHLELPDGSRAQALSADAHTLDGLSVHFAAIDELHAHPDRSVWDVILTATGARRQPLIVAATTAGARRDGICWEIDQYSRRVAAGEIEDPRHLGIIYEAEDGDPWDSEEAWRKANPNLGVSVKLEDLRHKAKMAAGSQPAIMAFAQKHCNRWSLEDSAWLDLAAWDACQSEAKLDDFSGSRIILACDLASKRDFAAVVALVKSAGHLFAFPRFFLPEARLDSPHGRLFRAWAQAGHIQLSEGDIIDFEQIERYIFELAESFRIAKIIYDPFQATQFATRMSKAGFPMIELGATVKNFSEPMKTLDALISKRVLRHDGNPVLRWMAGNVVAKEDLKGNIFPRKAHADAHIDGIVALIMAVAWDLRDPDWHLGGPSIPPEELMSQWLA